MQITITKGSGEGLTKLAAFDRALYNAGLANYNLIPLSSVIPPGAKILIQTTKTINENEYGHRLYVVMAKSFACEPGEEAWAGIGWVKHNDNSGKGLFVEHSGYSKKKVIKQIEDSLNSMAEYRPEERGKINNEICGIKCGDKPVCSIVVATYKSEGWE